VSADRGLGFALGCYHDVIFDAVGKHSFRGGIYLETTWGSGWHVPLLALATRWIGNKRVTLPVPKYTKGRVTNG
jgi:hypothetical protein